MKVGVEHVLAFKGRLDLLLLKHGGFDVLVLG
jgi:hypothetical protein